jgi:hypothetical protein
MFTFCVKYDILNKKGNLNMKKTVYSLALICATFVIPVFAEIQIDVLEVDRNTLLSDGTMLVNAYNQFNDNNDVSPLTVSNQQFIRWTDVLLRNELINEIPSYDGNNNFIWDIHPSERFIMLPSVTEETCNRASVQVDITPQESDESIFDKLSDMNRDACLKLNVEQISHEIYMYVVEI